MLIKNKNLCSKESKEQSALCEYLDLKKITYFAIPNGGAGNLPHGKFMRIPGFQGGIPDLFIPHARANYHGLFIEVKRLIGGVLSKDQKFWLEKLSSLGYLAVRANGFDEAKKIIDEYFK